MIVRDRKLKASITVEAAFSFTIMVFVLFMMLGPLLTIKTTSDFLIELNEFSKKRCYYETIKYYGKDLNIIKKVESHVKNEELLNEGVEVLENIVDYASIISKFDNKYSEKEREYRNIDYIYNVEPYVYDSETGIVKYDYLVSFSLPYNVLHVKNILKRLVNARRAFVGVDADRFNKDVEDGDFVYVANNYVNSGVYHLDINCTYLIKKTNSFKHSDLSNYRNYNGKKYTKCDYCFKNIRVNDDTTCYTTLYGDRYHYTSTCPLMTAYVTKIYKGNIDKYDLRPCFKCGEIKE